MNARMNAIKTSPDMEYFAVDIADRVSSLTKSMVAKLHQSPSRYRIMKISSSTPDMTHVSGGIKLASRRVDGGRYGTRVLHVWAFAPASGKVFRTGGGAVAVSSGALIILFLTPHQLSLAQAGKWDVESSMIHEITHAFDPKLRDQEVSIERGLWKRELDFDAASREFRHTVHGPQATKKKKKKRAEKGERQSRAAKTQEMLIRTSPEFKEKRLAVRRSYHLRPTEMDAHATSVIYTLRRRLDTVFAISGYEEAEQERMHLLQTVKDWAAGVDSSISKLRVSVIEKHDPEAWRRFLIDAYLAIQDWKRPTPRMMKHRSK